MSDHPGFTRIKFEIAGQEMSGSACHACSKIVPEDERDVHVEGCAGGNRLAASLADLGPCSIGFHIRDERPVVVPIPAQPRGGTTK